MSADRFAGAIARMGGLGNLDDDIDFDHMLEAYVATTYPEDAQAQRTIVLQHGVNREAVRAVLALALQQRDSWRARRALKKLYLAVQAEDLRVGPIVEAD